MVSVEERVLAKEHGHTTVVSSDQMGRYAFRRADSEHIADRVRGELPDIDEIPLVYIGDNFGKHYNTGHDVDEIPEDVLKQLGEKGMVVLDPVEGGWAQWEGRPEWSETYIDFSESEPVSVEA